MEQGGTHLGRVRWFQASIEGIKYAKNCLCLPEMAQNAYTQKQNKSPVCVCIVAILYVILYSLYCTMIIIRELEFLGHYC